ncbi:MAG: STAS-like domain-containing protein [Roseivirga sp.]|jgi:hypothetical protein|uniref:STAS-like domain-containing protein n=1 Tax=Roseivirga sp. TaxID=1964215 RepID=UPI001B17467D|nr:STAS-like domain-containing protein [Roseivirga sp.]MBO6659480.1 STAS-like domain-containing protein [Roseivirga sp.]MBO6762723.1 STAS-like domain-containing protein [Roseivirga sp.]MBO6907783.1 STAS-like domain-containing protein [Roseivirga sp.]
MKIIFVKDFTEFPGLRHCSISEDSGELYYHKVLNSEFANSLSDKSDLILNLDQTTGYPPSFLDEAIGNLVYDFTLDVVKSNLKIISEEEPDLLDLIEKETFPQWEKRRVDSVKPKKTKRHEPWFRFLNGSLTKTQG